MLAVRIFQDATGFAIYIRSAKRIDRKSLKTKFDEADGNIFTGYWLPRFNYEYRIPLEHLTAAFILDSDERPGW